MTYTISKQAFTVSALTVAAAALSGCSMQSYGHGGSYAGANCNMAASTACLPGHGQAAHGGQYGHYSGGLRGLHSGKTRYGTSYETAGYTQQTYMQPQMMQYMPMPYLQPTYQAASAPSYNVDMFQPTVSQTTSYAAPANCPAGTTAQSDGTCLQGSSTSYASSYSSPSYSTGYVTESCPAGSTASSDGTCLMGGTTTYSGSTYSGPTYGSTSNGVAPALSTHDFSDYNWGSKDTSWGSNSYVSPGTRSVDAPYNYPSNTTSPSYLPNRK